MKLKLKLKKFWNYLTQESEEALLHRCLYTLSTSMYSKRVTTTKLIGWDERKRGYYRFELLDTTEYCKRLKAKNPTEKYYICTKHEGRIFFPIKSNCKKLTTM